MSRYFPSKVDWWYHLVIVGLVFALAFAAYTVLVIEPEEAASTLPVLALAALPAIGLPLWLRFSTGYSLEPTLLRVKCGPFSWQIPLAEISNIRSTRNPLSSPALSLDRLMIEHARGRLMISPADKDGFLREVEALRGQLREMTAR